MTEDLRKELRNSIFQAKFGANVFYFFAVAILVIVIWPLQPIQGKYILEIYLFCLFLGFIWNAYRQTKNLMNLIYEIQVSQGLVVDLDGLPSDQPIDLGGFFLKFTNANATLKALIASTKDSELAKDVDWKGGQIYKTRGKDPRGPAKGKGADTFGEILSRVDAMTPRPEHEGIEGPLTKTEKMVEEVNEIAAEKALEQWNEAEAADPELIEAGVKRLGDLVASGHYKGPENQP